MKILSIIIPVFNEEKRLDKTFKAISTLALPYGIKLSEIIFVNDGSSDRTKDRITSFKKSSKLPIKLVSYSQNKGKGYAVKKGMLSSNSDYALLCDADMSTPFSELKKLTAQIKSGSDVAIGTRKNGKSTVIVHQPWLRENLGKGFTRFTQIALQLNITDFTCGFKLFNLKAVKAIFPDAVINRWGYDAEILYIASKKDLTITEKAVIWSDDKGSHVNMMTAIPNTILEIGKIITFHSILPYMRDNFRNPLAYAQKLAQRIS